MPLSGQSDSKEQETGDWLKWDPISSGEGDLLFEDIEKSFSVSANLTSDMNTVGFMSALNSLPSHGLRIKDIVCTPNSAPEPPGIAKRLVHLEKVDVPLAVNGIFEESLSEEVQTSMKNRYQDLSHEDSTGPLLHNVPVDDFVNVKENCDDKVAFDEMRTIKELDACSSLSETELRSLHSQSCSDNYDAYVALPDDATVRKCANDTEIVRTYGQFASAEIAIDLEDTVIPSSMEESKMSISFPVGVHAEASLMVEENKPEAVCNNGKKLSLDLSEAPSNEESKKIEQLETINHLGPFPVELQGEEFYNQKKEEHVFWGDKIAPVQQEELEKHMNSKTYGALNYHIRGESVSGNIPFWIM